MRKYKKPVLNVEQFNANEFISTCSDTESKYYVFKCDAGGGESGNVYLETNNVPGLQKDWNPWSATTPDTFRSGYKACGKEHYVKEGETFPEGYYVNSKTGEVTNVLVWKASWSEGYTHCTTALKENIKITQGNKS